MIAIKKLKKKLINNQAILSHYLLRLMYAVEYIDIINIQEYKYYN